MSDHAPSRPSVLPALPDSDLGARPFKVFVVATPRAAAFRLGGA